MPLRITGPRPVEKNGLRGFVTTFHFGNTHSVAPSSSQAATEQAGAPVTPPAVAPAANSKTGA